MSPKFTEVNQGFPITKEEEHFTGERHSDVVFHAPLIFSWARKSSYARADQFGPEDWIRAKPKHAGNRCPIRPAQSNRDPASSIPFGPQSLRISCSNIPHRPPRPPHNLPGRTQTVPSTSIESNTRRGPRPSRLLWASDDAGRIAVTRDLLHPGCFALPVPTFSDELLLPANSHALHWEAQRLLRYHNIFDVDA